MPTIRVATRQSTLATTQAADVAAALEAETGWETELVFVTTTGDRQDDVPLHTIGGQGVFVKEVQRAVLDGRADVAVHSAKDLPTARFDGLTIGAFCERASSSDALVGARLDDLAPGATIATGSVRRRAQLHERRPDLQFEELRGNITTRLERIPPGGAIVMAVAALERLGMGDRIADVLDPAVFVPAVGQGCVAVEHRTGDTEIAALVSALDHPPTRRGVEVERAFLSELGSGCALPLGAYADGATLHTFLASESGELVDRRTLLLLGGDADLDAARTAASQSATAVGAGHPRR